MKKTYYITTPVYYPSNNMHIGHSYTTIIADTMSRYKKMRGFDVKFLTGTDEHGQKIERIAKEKNITPIKYVDGIVKETKELWKLLDIEYDIFMRTSEQFHVETIQKIFKKLFDKGDIYKSFYEGLYCTPCESFFTERQLVNGNCPDCNRQIEKIQEESYFFKLSNYTEKLLNHIEQNPDFITPKSRQNEMINNFLKPGLEDLCVSRTSITWGIPVTFDEKHVVYVWIDALSNYITALGYLSNNDEEYKKYWPADVHVVGKDIVRFHTIIWPAILMALDEPLPKQVYGHGFLVIDGDKMSKSKGNVVDPNILVKRYGVDAIRYFLMREIPFGNDGNFTNEALINRINSDLANDFGNLLSRTVGMIEKYFNGSVSDVHEETEFDETIINLITKTFDEVEANMDKMNFSDALSNVWQLISRTNKYIDETSPWIMVKDDSQKPKLARVMYVLSEVLRCVSILISPLMPNTPKYVHNQLNMNDNNILNWSCAGKFGLLDKNITIQKGEIIFPRIDIEKEIESLTQEIENYKQNYNSNPTKENISIEEFSKIEIKIGKILECEKIKKSDKLLKSIVQIGEEKRQIVSGIATAYSPEEIIGKSVLVVTNLKTVKLKGVLSEGMILCASDENGKLRLVCPDDSSVESGWVVK